uniref:Transcriptional regulator, TrmB n=1 Tax=uncultured Chloroflexota bacterium TaxID=166587 RepID=H5SPH2_9CHLR|nr:transcriptional regulator, TrmB [uncultured Chloroflexota bacterium]
MKSTRERILQILARHPRQTINELAEAVGINPISVRHHLNMLQMEGLIASEEERHGVGRPRLVYFLTEKGRERFPGSYLRLMTRLLTQMKETMPAPMVNALFSQIAEELAQEYQEELANMSMEERLELVKELLSQEGFTVEWERTGDEYKIHEITCPYYHIGVNHPEVCTIDQALISKMLAVPAEKVQCILSGSTYCTYVIHQPMEKES